MNLLKVSKLKNKNDDQKKKKRSTLKQTKKHNYLLHITLVNKRKEYFRIKYNKLIFL